MGSAFPTQGMGRDIPDARLIHISEQILMATTKPSPVEVCSKAHTVGV